MPKSHFDKLISSINSCNTYDQYLQCHEWFFNLKELYTFGKWQLKEINDTFLKVAIKLKI